MSKRTREKEKRKLSQRKVFSLSQFWRDKNPILLFLLVFGALMAVFYSIWITEFFKENIFNPVLHVNAKIASFLLNLLGYGTTAAGKEIFNERFTISVRRGCDAIEPTALFVSAVLSFPASVKKKLPGIAAGIMFLLTVNLIRIVSLFLTGIHAPSLFEVMHLEVWQVIFIVLALVCWVVWIQWVMKSKSIHHVPG